MGKIDYVEVSRAAHELGARHGANAAGPYAMQLAEQARVRGDMDEQAFWEGCRPVAKASVRPRLTPTIPAPSDGQNSHMQVKGLQCKIF